MLRLLIVLLAFSPYLTYSQGNIEGIFEKQQEDTFTRMKFYQDGTFEYKWVSHLLIRELKGIYKVKDDTLVINSNRDFNWDSTFFEFRNEKWLIVNKNKIFS